MSLMPNPSNYELQKQFEEEYDAEEARVKIMREAEKEMNVLSKQSEQSAILVLNRVKQALIILGAIPFTDLEDCNVSDQEIRNALLSLHKMEDNLKKCLGMGNGSIT